ncbi:MAG: tyrosine--tRNA ligase [Actinobacteria bacterium]|uniref:tyrosine--tRNA ligase n=1 Tax=freshwater metagenome TaxID=449393 RepID=A0A6J6UMW7_9ZZZZ|nr:tyrosine--tRNA ligase [Actinomycetota bacterium]
MPTGAELLEELELRGLLQDSTDRDALIKRLDEGPIGLYCGFDPTADSLHIGNLQSIMLLRRFQLAGHRPIALVGGATGMIGDPSGRSDERQFLDTEVLDANRSSIGAQLTQLLDFEPGESCARLVDNRDWTEHMSVLDFLRDVGKYATINTMLAKESVKTRLQRESGISFTEFSYMLLQANDFLELHSHHQCDLQVAGSDQWGNITAGVDLVRRRAGKAVHGLTAPLIVRSDGTKFGKSEGENLWLSAERTSPFRMYQYLLNLPDGDVEQLLLRLTLLSVQECRQISTDHAAAPGERSGQRRLARELTSLLHGPAVIEPIEAASAVLFGAPISEADESALLLLSGELPCTHLPLERLIESDPVEILVSVGLAKSKGEIRRNPAGYYVNQVSLQARTEVGRDAMQGSDALHAKFILLQRGKNAYHLLVAD